MNAINSHGLGAAALDGHTPERPGLDQLTELGDGYFSHLFLACEAAIVGKDRIPSLTSIFCAHFTYRSTASQDM